MSSKTASRFLKAASAISLISAGTPALGQVLVLDEILVTSSRIPIARSDTGSTVSVIDIERIDELSLPTTSDYLAMVPGVNIASQGGQGKLSTLMMRGIPGEYVKTFVNGIDISDVSYTKVQTLQGQMLSGVMDRMEVLKGSQSTLYGSDAIAGVVDVTTLGGIDLGVRHRVAIEGGSHGTVSGSYGLDAASERAQFGLAIAGLHTDGFSAAARGTEDDGFKDVTGTVAGRYEIDPDLTLFASGLLIDSHTDFDDGYPAPDYVLSDSDAVSDYRQLAGRIGAEFNLFDGRLKNTLAAQIGKTERTSTSDNTTDTFEGQRAKLDYMGSIEVLPELALNFGAEWQRLTADTSAGIHRSINTGGGWAEAIYSPIDPLTLTLGLRHDRHSTFGGNTSWRTTGSYQLGTSGARLHASVGTGYRAPSLFELYNAESGNPDLQPETSTSFDIGVEQSLIGGLLVADVTYFQIDIKDYIEWVRDNPDDPSDWDGTYSQEQGGKLRSRGVETSITYAATDWLDLMGSYTFTSAKQADGSRQVRVPMHDIRLSASVRPAEKWTVSTTARIAFNTVDYLSVGTGKIDDYVLVNAKVAYKPNDDTELYVRAENLLDQDYQVVDGYNTAPFSLFAGIKASF